MKKMNLILSNQIIKPIKKKPSISKPSILHPVNNVLSEIVSKKPFKSCGCGK